jgi:hypothetical protein
MTVKKLLLSKVNDDLSLNERNGETNFKKAKEEILRKGT